MWPTREEIDLEQKVALLAIKYIEESEKFPRDKETIKLIYNDLKQAVVDLKAMYKEN